LTFPHCFNGWFGREAGYGPADHSNGLGVVSGAMDLFKYVDDFTKDCYVWTT
jgi:hypothetical protein